MVATRFSELRGSGETVPAGRRLHESLFRGLEKPIFPLSVLGAVRLPALEDGLPAEVIETVLETEQEEMLLPAPVASLIQEREEARRAREWARAHELRWQLERLG